jgi:predicted dienelactone hydrolase
VKRSHRSVELARRARAQNVRFFQPDGEHGDHLKAATENEPRKDDRMSQPTSTAPVLSIHPITLPVPGRAVPLQLRVSAPAVGNDLPILLLSHGHGPSNYISSLQGYAPLANDYAAHGFVVIQPTHLDSKTLPFRSSDHPDAPLFWRSRAEDMQHILDHLADIEREFPAIAGRVDRVQVGVVGHSMGGHTASVLLGARHRDPRTGSVLSVTEPRIKAGVLLAAPGRGEALSAYAKEHYAFLSTIDFSSMTAPALVVAGDKDDHPFMKTAGAAWHADPYLLSPAPKSLLTLFGGEHGLGGIAGYDVAETSDESPERAGAVQLLTRAYLRSQLFAGDQAWPQALRALADAASPLARVESK